MSVLHRTFIGLSLVLPDMGIDRGDKHLTYAPAPSGLAGVIGVKDVLSVLIDIEQSLRR
jgi:hypothetical protein